jgi:hypothetical protein
VSPLPDIEPQTAAGKVCLHFLISLDGFAAGPLDGGRPVRLERIGTEPTLTASVRYRPAAAAPPG